MTQKIPIEINQAGAASGFEKLDSMDLKSLIRLREQVENAISRAKGKRQDEAFRTIQDFVDSGIFSKDDLIKKLGGSLMILEAQGGAARGRKIPPKYRNSDDPSQVWTGRGATPKWMRAHLAQGRDKEDFLIEI